MTEQRKHTLSGRDVAALLFVSATTLQIAGFGTGWYMVLFFCCAIWTDTSVTVRVRKDCGQ